MEKSLRINPKLPVIGDLRLQIDRVATEENAHDHLRPLPKWASHLQQLHDYQATGNSKPQQSIRLWVCCLPGLATPADFGLASAPNLRLQSSPLIARPRFSSTLVFRVGCSSQRQPVLRQTCDGLLVYYRNTENLDRFPQKMAWNWRGLDLDVPRFNPRNKAVTPGQPLYRGRETITCEADLFTSCKGTARAPYRRPVSNYIRQVLRRGVIFFPVEPCVWFRRTEPISTGG